MDSGIAETIIYNDDDMRKRIEEVALHVPCFDASYTDHLDVLTATVFLRYGWTDAFSWRDMEGLIDDMATRMAD